MKLVPRHSYTDWLHRWKNKNVIKVISGVRRCGKSTLLAMFQDELLDAGVSPERLITINFENVENENLTDYHKLYSFITNHLDDSAITYIFLDEIQHVDGFEKMLDSLYSRSECDLFVTGSNAHMLSGELATLLTGRYVELKMLPLSFSEFCMGANTFFNWSDSDDSLTWSAGTKDNAFSTYLATGGFPFVLEVLDNAKTVMEYLHDVYQSILYRDIVARFNIGDAALLERIGKMLASEVGSLISINKIANTLRSSGRSADQKTVDKYVEGFVKSMLFYEVPRWDIKGRKLLSRISKYYIVDTGLRSNLVRGSSDDIGHLLENVIFLELKRRGGDIYVGNIGDNEVDFVVIDGGEIQYFQVAASVIDHKTLERELAPFNKIKDNHPKTLLTLDRVLPTTSIEGVRVINAIDWLLESEG